jgi:osmotically inducible protein OsmC
LPFRERLGEALEVFKPEDFQTGIGAAGRFVHELGKIFQFRGPEFWKAGSSTSGGAVMTAKKGYAIWEGGIKDGGGTISTETGVLKDAPYGFKSRFENGKGTNPEELIGAAHAGCFSMALSLMLGEAGMTPERIETCATITLEKIGEGFEITRSHLDVKAKIPGADKAKFDEIANKAKAGCPVSRLFKATITMNATLTS